MIFRTQAPNVMILSKAALRSLRGIKYLHGTNMFLANLSAFALSEGKICIQKISSVMTTW